MPSAWNQGYMGFRSRPFTGEYSGAKISAKSSPRPVLSEGVPRLAPASSSSTMAQVRLLRRLGANVVIVERPAKSLAAKAASLYVARVENGWATGRTDG